ncbi:unnamed protein product [Phaeothamnion confervicola]
MKSGVLRRFRRDDRRHPPQRLRQDYPPFTTFGISVTPTAAPVPSFASAASGGGFGGGGGDADGSGSGGGPDGGGEVVAGPGEGCRELKEFLTAIGLSAYNDTFVQHGFDVDTVLESDLAWTSRTATRERATRPRSGRPSHSGKISCASRSRRRRRRRRRPGRWRRGRRVSALCAWTLIPCHHMTCCSECVLLIRDGSVRCAANSTPQSSGVFTRKAGEVPCSAFDYFAALSGWWQATSCPPFAPRWRPPLPTTVIRGGHPGNRARNGVEGLQLQIPYWGGG